LGRYDPQRSFHFPWSSDVGAKVEQLVLDLTQAERQFALADRGDGNADRRVGLVDLADGGHSRGEFGDAAAVDQSGAAAVAGPRVYFV